MRRKLVAGNWKMNGTLASNEALLRAVIAGCSNFKGADYAVCVPFPYLSQAQGLLTGGNVALGAQTLSEHASGAYTGEVAGAMLKEFACSYVIVGHSERRHLYGESDSAVANKYVAAQKVELTPIFCVGETLGEREANATESVIARQLNAVFDGAGVASLASAVIAYEPVWAIGTGKTATPEQAQSVHSFIRESISRRDAALAAGVRILYGGSVKSSNAAQLLASPDVDGGLIGGASLVAEDFLAICRAAQSS